MGNARTTADQNGHLTTGTARVAWEAHPGARHLLQPRVQPVAITLRHPGRAHARRRPARDGRPAGPGQPLGGHSSTASRLAEPPSRRPGMSGSTAWRPSRYRGAGHGAAAPRGKPRRSGKVGPGRVGPVREPRRILPRCGSPAGTRHSAAHGPHVRNSAVMDVRWLKPTAANTAKALVTIPPGFHRVSSARPPSVGLAPPSDHELTPARPLPAARGGCCRGLGQRVAVERHRSSLIQAPCLSQRSS